MTGEWVEGMGEGEERVYLGGRRYDVEWAKEELGYGGRQDAGVLRGMLSRK